jgi:hypothetical protein
MGGTDALTLTIILNRFGSVCLELACLLGHRKTLTLLGVCLLRRSEPPAVWLFWQHCGMAPYKENLDGRADQAFVHRYKNY